MPRLRRGESLWLHGRKVDRFAHRHYTGRRRAELAIVGGGVAQAVPPAHQ